MDVILGMEKSVVEICADIALLPADLQEQVKTFIAFQKWKEANDSSFAQPFTRYKPLEERFWMAAEGDSKKQSEEDTDQGG